MMEACEFRKSKRDKMKNKRMYPKVKVRTEEDGEPAAAVHEHNWSSLLSLKDISFLLLQDSRFPVKQYRDLSPPRIARVPKSYVPNVILPTSIVLPSESASEGSDKKSNSDEEDRPNIRASSVPRPRAVLSSPVNDAVIGSRNRVKVLRPSALKNRNEVQSRQTQCKTVRDQVVDGKNPPSLRKWNDNTDTKVEVRVKKGSDTTDTKFDLRVKKGSATTTPQRTVAASKPSTVKI